ncbi:MAG: SGNH/GDSL hydrolase family protein [Candidatus Omnitrophica bacterium]|nr:SGNH/GDSL hydrolase family protein [Candidatus Omnitrophota bacterium]
MKEFLLLLTTSIVSILLLFVFLELVSFCLNPIVKLSHGQVGLGIGGKDALEYSSGYIKDRELFWKLDPSCEEYNSLGFRDKEISPHKGSNTFRIICVGDSVTFGWPCKIEETYPKVLEKLLNSHFSQKRFEVFNAGVPGYSSYQGLIWLRKDIIKYKPDLIIIYYGINDRSASNRPDNEQKVLPEWIVRSANYLRKFHFYKLFNKIKLYFKYPPTKENHYRAVRVPPSNFKNNLIDMKKLTEENRAKILFISNPVLYDPGKKIVFTDRRYSPPENMLEFDIYNIFKKREKEADRFFLDDWRPYNFHLTRQGQKILAEELFRFLIENNIVSE